MHMYVQAESELGLQLEVVQHVWCLHRLPLTSRSDLFEGSASASGLCSC